MEWIFSGIGTETISVVISLIIGALGGGVAGYKIGVKRTTKQKQAAGDNSIQKQELRIKTQNTGQNFVKRKTTLKQTQKAGSNASQTQIGDVDDVR